MCLTVIQLIHVFTILQAALGCNSAVTLELVNKSEPYLADPIAFPKIQVGLFIFVLKDLSE